MCAEHPWARFEFEICTECDPDYWLVIPNEEAVRRRHLDKLQALNKAIDAVWAMHFDRKNRGK